MVDSPMIVYLRREVMVGAVTQRKQKTKTRQQQQNQTNSNHPEKLLWSLKPRQICSFFLLAARSCSKKRCKTSCKQDETELE